MGPDLAAALAPITKPYSLAEDWLAAWGLGPLETEQRSGAGRCTSTAPNQRIGRRELHGANATRMTRLGQPLRASGSRDDGRSGSARGDLRISTATKAHL